MPIPPRYAAAVVGAPAYYSATDYRHAFFAQESGLSDGTLNDHMYKYFKDESLSVEDLSLNDYIKITLDALGFDTFEQWEWAP